LQRNKKYLVSFYIKSQGDNCKFFISDFGVRFSKEREHYKDVGCREDYKYSASAKCDYPIKDTVWRRVELLYVAKGGEKYFTMGDYYDPEYKYQSELWCKLEKREKRLQKFYSTHQNLIVLNPSYNGCKDLKKDTYYYIDDVSVELVDDSFELNGEQNNYVRPK